MSFSFNEGWDEVEEAWGWMGKRDDDDEDNDNKQRRTFLIFIVGVGIIIGSLALVALYFLTIWLWSLITYLWGGATQFFAGFPGVVAGILVILLVAFGLFELRKHAHLYYGILEICFALTTSSKAVFDLLNENSDTKHWIVVGGAVYLFVRGMDNIWESVRSKPLTREQKRQILVALKKWARQKDKDKSVPDEKH